MELKRLKGSIAKRSQKGRARSARPGHRDPPVGSRGRPDPRPAPPMPAGRICKRPFQLSEHLPVHNQTFKMPQWNPNGRFNLQGFTEINEIPRGFL